MVAILAMEDADFSFGNRLIFKGVNLEISQGETLCLLGPNGCGKTTLMDCLLGINKLDKGKISLENKPVLELSPKQIAQKIAYVPQKHNRHFSFSVMDVLLMGRTPYTSFYASPGQPAVKMVEEVLDTMGLIHLKNRDYTHLSGGETQLVMIMRALIQDTPVIIMDEPTAHLDFKNELIVLETIVKLVKERGRTLIMATHFPNHAFYLENKGIRVQVAFMDKNKVHTAGSPSKALTEKNLEAFYNVKTSIICHQIPGKGKVRQIIPIQTMDNNTI